MKLAVSAVLLNAGAVLSLQSITPARPASPSLAAATSRSASASRRDAIFGAAAGMLAFGVHAAGAYDAIPNVEPDFAAMEKARAERAAKSAIKTKSLTDKTNLLFTAKNEDEWIAACDEVSLWVIGEGAVPEGIRIKQLVAEIKLAFANLPQKAYACEYTRTNKGICYTPGKGAELAFDSMLKELRKYSMIQLGDYRRVEFNAF